MAHQRGRARIIPVQEQRAAIEESTPTPVPDVDGSHSVPAMWRAEERSNPVASLARLPVELIHEVLRISADDCGAKNRSTVNAISRTCCLGYTIAIPFLYRVVVVDVPDYMALYKHLFDEQSAFTDGIVCKPAVHRLCPLVQHLVLREPGSLLPLTPDHFGHLNRLSSISINYVRPAVNLPTEILGPTRVHFDDGLPRLLPPSVTHVSLLIPIEFDGFIDLDEFRILDEEANWSPTVTHVSLRFIEGIRDEHQLTRLLNYFLNLPSIEKVVVHLSESALDQDSQDVAICGIFGAQDLSRVFLWTDYDRLDEDGRTVDATVDDAYADRTPWTEAREWTARDTVSVAILRIFSMMLGSGGSEDDGEDNDEEEDDEEDEEEDEEEHEGTEQDQEQEYHSGSDSDTGAVSSSG